MNLQEIEDLMQNDFKGRTEEGMLNITCHSKHLALFQSQPPKAKPRLITIFSCKYKNSLEHHAMTPKFPHCHRSIRAALTSSSQTNLDTCLSQLFDEIPREVHGKHTSTPF